MKRRSISLGLAALLLLCICGCTSNSDNSSDTVIVEEIIMDESGNAIVNSDSTVSTPDATSSQPTSSGTGSKTPVNIDYDTVVEIDICNEVVRSYLDAKDAYNQYFWLSKYNGQKLDYQNVTLEWNNDGSTEFTVYFSKNADFSNAQIAKTKSLREVKNATLIPGETYYWKVLGTYSNEPLGGGKIRVKDAPVRWICIDGIKNVRDMGGWKTTSGKKVKYGMLYRGAQLNTEKNGVVVNAISEKGLATFNSLGIKTEFDLRSAQNVHVPPQGVNLNHVWISNENSGYSAYGSISAKSQKDMYKKMFEYLSDRSNYPIYTNCQGGADRTGTYAFLLNGLLGVSYEDLTRDFELTSFSGTTRWRSAGNGTTFSAGDADYTDGSVTVSWRALYEYMMDYGKQNGCSTLEQSIEHWFVNYVGVPKSQIDSFRAIMLG